MWYNRAERRMGRRLNARERVRQRMLARLDELGMTARELALRVRGEGADSWISAILSGTNALSWKYFDEVCRELRLTPGELVRSSDVELAELTPSEMRVIRHFREWPRQIQDRWLHMLEYFSASIPDKETARFLQDWKELSAADRQRIHLFLRQRLPDTHPQTDLRVVRPPDSVASASAPDTTPGTAQEETPRATHRLDDDPP